MGFVRGLVKRGTGMGMWDEAWECVLCVEGRLE